MNQPKNPNAGLLLSAVQMLVPLLDQIAFVGGCASGLLITDPGAAPVRPTVDVDAIVEIASYAKLVEFEARLRQLGFDQPQVEGAPLCRWMQGDLILDLMPTDSAILGFGNRWYRPALENTATVKIGEHRARLISGPYFLATKFEAFRGRGRFEYRTSRDVEDIVTVIDGRPEVVSEVQQSDNSLRKYLSDEFSTLLSERDFLEALPGHLLPDPASQQRIGIILEHIQRMVTKG